MKLSQIDDELFAALRKDFRCSIISLEAADDATWYNYYALGLELYQHGEALSQVWGSRKNYRKTYRQAAHFDMASIAFDRAIDIVQANPGPNPLEDAARIDVLKCLIAVTTACIMRAYSQIDDMTELLPTVIGNDTSPGIVGRCMERLQESPDRQRHFAAVASSVGFRLACGEVFGFLPTQDSGKADSLLGDALDLFQAESADSLDKEYSYRRLLLDAALEAHARGDRTVRRMYARMARRSAVHHDYPDQANHARLVGLFGRLGNKLWYAMTLLKLQG